MEIDGKEVWRCPRRPILEDPEFYGQLFWMYQGFQKGFLPEGGGLHDQPALVIDAFRVIDRALNEVEEEKKKRDARKRARTKAGGAPRGRHR